MAVDTADVDGEQDVDAVPGAGSDLRAVTARVQPERQGSVAEVLPAR